MAIALMLVVRVGIPVAVLFALGYWLEQRHQSLTSDSDTALPESSQIGHNETAHMRNGEEGGSNAAHEIRLDAVAPLDRAGKAEDIEVAKASMDIAEALTQGSGPGSRSFLPSEEGVCPMRLLSTSLWKGGLKCIRKP